MAAALGSSFIGATVVRHDSFHHAQCAIERRKQRKKSDAQKRSWVIAKLQKWKTEIREKFLRRRQFRWKRIDATQEYES